MDGKTGFTNKIKDIAYFEVGFDPDLSQKNCIKIDEINEFLRYMKINDIKSAFVNFGYYNPNEYKLTTENFDEKYHKHLGVLRAGLDMRDVYIQRMHSYEEPNSVAIFFSFGGYTIYYKESDPWLDRFYVEPKIEYIKKVLPRLDAELEKEAQV